MHSTVTLEAKGNAGYLTFKDTGQSIPKNQLSKLFKALTTFDKTGGTGLGVHFCQNVITAFGGDIVCTSKVGEYTQFTLVVTCYQIKCTNNP